MKIKFTFKILFRSKDIESKLSFRWANLNKSALELTEPACACICDLSSRSSTLIFGFLYLIRHWRETPLNLQVLFLFGFSPLSLGCDSPSIVASQEVLQLTVNTNERIERFQ